MLRIGCCLVVLIACGDFVVIGSHIGTPRSFHIPLYFPCVQLQVIDDFGIQSVH